MSDIKKIIGVTVGTPLNPVKLAEKGGVKENERKIGVLENKIAEKGSVIPLAYNEWQPSIDILETKHPASAVPNQYAWLAHPANKLVISQYGVWVEVTPSPYDTYLFENRIFHYKSGKMTEVEYLRDIEAVTQSVIASLPIYNGEVEYE